MKFRFVIFAMIFLAGCSGPSESEKLYNKAFDREIDQGINSAIPVYKEVVLRYSHSKAASLAKNKIQEYEQEKRARELKIERERAEREEISRLAKSFGNSAGEKIMSAAGGGQDLRVQINNWDYDNQSERFEIKIEVYWNGAIFRDHNYNVDGVLKVDRSGRNSEFSRTYANSNFKDLESTMMWVGAGVALGVLAATQN